MSTTERTAAERIAELEAALRPFAELRVALELINADKRMELEADKAIFQTWGLRGTDRARQITLGHLHDAALALNMSSMAPGETLPGAPK